MRGATLWAAVAGVAVGCGAEAQPARSKPAIAVKRFAAWHPAVNGPHGPDAYARYDVAWVLPATALLWGDGHPERFTAAVHRRNPDCKLLAAVWCYHYWDRPQHLPKRFFLDPHGGRSGPEGSWRLDLDNPDVQRHVAELAAEHIAKGFDGVMADWYGVAAAMWPDQVPGICATLDAIRERIGPDKLILANTNAANVPVAVLRRLDGAFVEGRTQLNAHLSRRLRYYREHLRRPSLLCLEVWRDNADRPTSQGEWLDAARWANRHDALLLLSISNRATDEQGHPRPDHLHWWHD